MYEGEDPLLPAGERTEQVLDTEWTGRLVCALIPIDKLPYLFHKGIIHLIPRSHAVWEWKVFYKP